MSEKLVGYFGFGSLVNRNTLRTSYVETVPATLNGFSRHWEPRPRIFGNNISLLSVHEDTQVSIKGMVVVDLLDNLPLVDEREAGYTRHKLSREQLELHASDELPDELYVYIADKVEDANEQGTLLQSYIDAVMQGFRNEYGDAGVAHFVDTTKGFDRHVHLDRPNPFYPRHVELSHEEISLFDAELKRAGVLGI